MRVGIISDVHGNRVALEAALAALERVGVDTLVCLGDVAATGPQPTAAIALLQESGAATVMGNTDAWLLDPPAERPTEGDDRILDEVERWGAARLGPDDRAFLEGFAPTVSVPLPGGRTLLACHGSPRSFDEELLPTLSDAELAEILSGVTADVVAAGHTHLPMVRRTGRRLLLNPGSVGLPFDPQPPGPDSRHPAWAEYAVLEADERGGLAVTLGRVGWDAREIVAAAKASGMPHAAWYTAGWAREG